MATEARNRALGTVAAAAAEIATYCDHAEHAEPTDPQSVANVAESLCLSALDISSSESVDLVAAYAARVQGLEERSPIAEAPEGFHEINSAQTWRDLQTAQVHHDARFHPDVWGLTRAEQLRHCAFHVAKFPAALLASDDAEFTARRLPDMLLFALKLWTLDGTKLPESALRSEPESDLQPPWPTR